MKLYTYLNYGGNCRQAFEFYAEHLGGKITSIAMHGDQPDAKQSPTRIEERGSSARIELGDTTVMGADVPADRFQPMRSAYLTLLLDSVEDAERIYALLIEGGQIFMKMEDDLSSRSASRCCVTASAPRGCCSTRYRASPLR